VTGGRGRHPFSWHAWQPTLNVGKLGPKLCRGSLRNRRLQLGISVSPAESRTWDLLALRKRPSLFRAGQARVPRTIPIHATTEPARLVRAELVRTVTSISRRTRINRIATFFATIDHEQVAVLLNVIAGNTPPVLVAERWPSIVPLECRSLADALRISSFGCGTFHSMLQ